MWPQKELQLRLSETLWPRFTREQQGRVQQLYGYLIAAASRDERPDDEMKGKDGQDEDRPE
jgi:hypothetical protein